MQIYTLTKDYTYNKVVNGSLLKGDTVIIRDEVNGGCECVSVKKVIVNDDKIEHTHTQSCGYGHADQIIAEFTETKMLCPLYKKAFPDFELDVEIPEGFEDVSYKNDECPSWINYKYGIKLFIDHQDAEKSSYSDANHQDNYNRFSVIEFDKQFFKDGDEGSKNAWAFKHYHEALNSIKNIIDRPVVMENTTDFFHHHLSEMYKRLCEENGYELVSMDEIVGTLKNTDHNFMIEMMLKLWNESDEYESNQEREANALRNQLSKYIETYGKDMDTADIVADLL